MKLLLAAGLCWLLGLPAISLAVDVKETPGKTPLIPFHEIAHINTLSRQADVLSGDERRLQIPQYPNSSVLKNVMHQDEFYIAELPERGVEEVILLRETPLMRGRLFDVFDGQDRPYLSQLHLRFRFKKGQELILKNSTDKKHLIKCRDIIFTVDYSIGNGQQLTILKNHIQSVDEMGLAAHFQMRTLTQLMSEAKRFKKLVHQYALDLNHQEAQKLLWKVLKRIEKRGEYPVYNSRTNSSATHIYEPIIEVIKEKRGMNYLENSAIRMRSRTRDQRAYARLKFNQFRKNPFLVRETLKLMELERPLNEFRHARLRDEYCSNTLNNVDSAFCPTLANPLDHRISKIPDNLNTLEEEIRSLARQMNNFFEARKERNFMYIHKGEEERMDMYAKQVVAIDDEILRAQKLMPLHKELGRLRYRLYSAFLKSITANQNYDEIRAFEEGAEDKSYPRFFIRHILSGMPKLIKTAGRNHDFDAISLAEIKDIKSMFIDTKLDNLGNKAGEKVINVLGQVFKKRDWVPYLRVSTMFRDNYLTAHRERVFKDLFGEGGMEMGDIILEKDMQANTDVLIPGYWVHASIFMGTIKEMKAIGIWDDPGFSIIRYEIEKYRTDASRQYYLNTKWKNKLPFDEIPWFFESDRPGVGVHPFIKFLRTDGMAVLRPTKNWNEQTIKWIMKRANERMYFPYDYVHNVRNKFYVSCSKVVLKVFDQITFPVSQNLGYISVSPDQIGQPVSLDPTRADQGELKLIMFLDAHQEGKMTFKHDDPSTYENYETYLKATGTIK